MNRNWKFTAAAVLFGTSVGLTSCGGENTETTTTPNSTSIESEQDYERDRTQIDETEAEAEGGMTQDTSTVQ